MNPNDKYRSDTRVLEVEIGDHQFDLTFEQAIELRDSLTFIIEQLVNPDAHLNLLTTND